MKTLSIFLAVFLLSTPLLAQEQSFSFKRTKSHSESVKFGPGGTISVVGAPNGGVTVKGWNKNEVKVEADITVYANSEKDAKRISDVTGFGIEESITSLRIHTFGTHDKKQLKKIDKKFPKKLRKNPFEFNYTIYVPVFSDLRIDGGTGKLEMEGVEGVFIVNFFKSDAKLNLIGGRVMMTIGTGNLDVVIGTRSWRGRMAEINLQSGNLNLHLPNNMNANLNANVLRTGKIYNKYSGLVPRERTKFSDKQIIATAGNGGATLNFTVGDGDLNIISSEKSN